VSIVLGPEAEADLQEARDWYEAQRPGLGGDFIKEVDAAFQRLAAAPQRLPKLHGDLRRALVRRFPYAVYFLSSKIRITIVAVLHQRRDPAVWQKRHTP
jgi:plasmid stabilization system protein ParE